MTRESIKLVPVASRYSMRILVKVAAEYATKPSTRNAASAAVGSRP